MNVNTTAIENLAIGAEFAFSTGRFGIVAKRIDDQVWTFDLLSSDMQATGNWSQVYSRDGQTLTAHADYDNGESFTSATEHHGAHSAIRDALVILTIG
jgi:hypothetical protein